MFLQVYPDADHSLRSVNPHHYVAMEDYLDSCLGPIPDYFSEETAQSSGLDQLKELFRIEQ